MVLLLEDPSSHDVCTNLTREIDDLKAQKQVRDCEINRLNQLLAEIINSKSWRLMRVLREYNLFFKTLASWIKLGYQSDYGSLLVDLWKRAYFVLPYSSQNSYLSWIKNRESTTKKLKYYKSCSENYQPNSPLFSIILPVYKLPRNILKDTLASLQAQTWQNWECCLLYADVDNAPNWNYIKQIAACDPRFKIRREENAGISQNSNMALTLASGQFVVLLDHDDTLPVWILSHIALEIQNNPDVDFLYTDKDCIDASGKRRLSPLFKPGWSPEMLYSANYLTHLNVMRRSLVEQVGGWRSETDGAQDWDIFLRVTEQAKKIIRVNGVGYHWRIIAGSTSTGLAAKPYAALAQLRTIESRLLRLGLQATVAPSAQSGFHVMWNIEEKVTVDVILFGFASDETISRLWQSVANDGVQCVKSVTLIRDRLSHTQGEHLALGYPIPFTLHYYDNASDFNDLMQQAWSTCSGSVVMTVNVGATHFSPNSFREIIGWTSMHPDIAFTSALLLTEHDVVLESGRILGDDLRTLPLFYQANLLEYGLFGGPLWYRNVSAVSMNFAAFKRSLWDENQPTYATFTDTITYYCTKSLQLGFRGLVNPYARAYFSNDFFEAPGEYNASFASDPYFHPEFESIAPLKLKRC